MSNWIPITLKNLYDAKIQALVDACDQAALASGQANRSTGIMAGVVADIRAHIASHQRNQVDANTANIPIRLKSLAVRQIIWELKDALEMEATDIEKKNRATDVQLLRDIAAGRQVVDAPDTPIVATVEPLVPPPSFGHRPHRRQNQVDG